ncbi:MAG: hypothetical protein MJZ25_13090 [Fibrobacter sp.]|nr:hypothetical protein [Fibrobacter sp.]
MFSEMSDTYVDMAVLAEYIAARDQHGPTYKDDDEATVVLKEEVYETYVEADMMADLIRHPIEEADLKGIEEHARNCLKEAAQVLAVCRKWKDTKGHRPTEEEVEQWR